MRILTLLFLLVSFTAGAQNFDVLPTVDTVLSTDKILIRPLSTTSPALRRITLEQLKRFVNRGTTSQDTTKWSLTGNAGTTAGTNFIGTTDSKDLYFKTKNTTAIVVDTNQNVGIGTVAPVFPLDVNGAMQVVLNTNNGIYMRLDNAGFTANATGETNFRSAAFKVDTTGFILLDANDSVNVNTTQLQLKINATQGAGKVLTSDADGNASWAGAVYGAYYDTTTQINKGATVENYIHCNSTFEQSDVTRIDDSTFTLSQSGVYQISFTAQCSKTDGGVDNVRFYLKQDGGVDLPFTSGIIGLANANATHAATWTWVRSFNANDTIHILWQSEDTDLFLEKVERGSTPNTPAVPSVTISIVKIK